MRNCMKLTGSDETKPEVAKAEIIYRVNVCFRIRNSQLGI